MGQTKETKETKVKVKAPMYVVAHGKALTSKRGIIGEGRKVVESDLAGGKPALEAFVKSGHIVAK